MDENKLREELQELSALGPRRGVPLLIQRIGDSPAPIDLQFVLAVVRSLCGIGPPWVHLFERYVRDKKMPAVMRVPIRAMLEELRTPHGRALQSSPYVSARTYRTANSSGRISIASEKELGIYKEQHALLKKIEELSRQKLPVDLELHFVCDRVLSYGLAILAAWCAKNAASVRVSTAHTATLEFLRRIGFVQTVEQPRPLDAPRYDEQNHVAITHVSRSKIEEASQIARRLVVLFARHMTINDEQQRALNVVFAELVENVYRHSRSDYPGFVLAQAHPARQLLHMTIVDTGIGIHTSFQESPDEAMRQRAKNPAESLKLALEKLVTSKTSEHSGYGLYVVSDIVRRNGGTFRITSGQHSYMIQEGRRGNMPETPYEHARWNGTEVSAMFRLDRPMPIAAVYESLGPNRDAEDFFD